MGMYRKKPIVIEAREIRAYTDLLGDEGIANWCRGGATQDDGGPVYLLIPTLEGVMRADIGDWVIKGIQGEFYPCKNSIFRDTYESVG